MFDLFRREAVEASLKRVEGRVVLASPIPLAALSWLATATVLAAFAFAATASFARTERVTGWLTSSSGVIRPIASQGGTVELLPVHEGQVVKAGQVLAVLRVSPALEGGDSGRTLASGLAQEAEAAQERRRASELRLANEETRLHGRRAGLVREIAEAEHRVGIQREQVRLAQAEQARGEEMTRRGYMTRRDLDARRSTVLAAEARLSELLTISYGLRRDLSDIDARIEVLPSERAALRADLSTAEAVLAQRRTETAVRSQYVVVSPIDGRVAALPIEVGRTLQAGSPVAVVMPLEGVLEAQLYIPSRAAGFIRTGQPVELMYQAYPHQKFGGGEGTIGVVSQTVLEASELGVPGLNVSEPVFRARVKLDRDSIDAYGQTLPLRPGMLLSAEIVVDRRSLLEWLLDPLYASGHRH